MNKRRSFYNIVIGIGSQLISIILGIVIPRLFLMSYGSEMNGFLNSISQIFTYFSLLEAGIGAATLQALYAPVAKADKYKISGIMSATDHYYRKTGKIYLIAVIVLSIIYPLLLNSNISKFIIFLIILFNGIPGVVSYYFQGKYIILLQAEGKNYINTALSSLSSTLISLIKILLLFSGCNIIVIQLSYLIVNLLKVIIIGLYINRCYGWINLQVRPNYTAINQKNAAFVNQLCDLIFRNTDTLILTIFCDLKVVSVYAMYSLLYSMIRTALDYIAQGFSFVMGQTYNRDLKQYEKLHDLYETYRMALIFALYNIALIFIIPFMKLYTAGVLDINYIDYGVAALFTIFYLMTGARSCAADLINYAQHFKKTQSRCILEALINLATSLVAVNIFGIYGVLIGTIAALLYRMNDMLIYANRRILKRSPWVSYKRLIINSGIFVVITLMATKIPWKLDSYIAIIGWACVSGIVISCIYFGLASVTNKASFELLKLYMSQEISKVLNKQ